MHRKHSLQLAVVAAVVSAGALLSLNPTVASGEPVTDQPLALSPAPAPRISEADAISSALNHVYRSGSEIHLHNPRHDVVFDSLGVRFTPWRAQEDWNWSLSSVRKGEANVEVMQEAEPLETEDLVSYDRGLLTEQYVVKPYSIEQQFLLHAPIAVDGDLVVSGTVLSEGKFSVSGDGWNWGDIKLGDVTVYDAAGIELEASMQVSADSTTIRVSGADLATAAYPVLIDPEIGTNDFRISDVGGNGANNLRANEAEVAYNTTDNEYLVIWHGTETLINDEDIYGQRINAATGAEVGTNDFQISSVGSASTTEDGFFADLAWNSVNNEYLVAWEDTRGGDREIWGQFVGNTGTLIGSDFQISDMGTSAADPTQFVAQEPAVSHNPTNNKFLVAWVGDDNVNGLVNGETEQFGQLIDGATRSATGPDDFQISFAAGANGASTLLTAFGDPRIAYSTTQNEFFVVWEGEDTGHTNGETEIYSQRVNANTGALVGNNTRLTLIGGMIGQGSFFPRPNDPDVVWNPVSNEYLVVYESDGANTGEYAIHGQRVNAATGATTGTSDFSIINTGPANDTDYDQVDPKVAYNSTANEYVVVAWGDDVANNANEVFLQRVSATGTLIGTTETISDMGDATGTNYRGQIPDIAYSTTSQSFLVVWDGDDNVAPLVDNDLEIFGQRWELPDNPPSITANAGGVTVTQGQTNTGATIATVSDVEDSNGSLTVTATSVPTGITVNNITNTNGTITANVSATAAAAPGANSVTLQVEDSATNQTTDTLTVTVIDDANPTITAGSAINVTEGQTVTGATIATVSDAEDATGSLSVTATSVPTGITVTNITNTNGTITADVSATTAATLGANSVTLQVQDSISQTTTDTLTVNVLDDADPTITAASPVNVTEGQTITGVTIATVSDVVDANGSLTVTATSLPTGITVANITNTSGTITADISATTAATLGANSVTLQVQDSLSQTSTDTLTVTVVDDTNPTITASSTITVSQGGSSNGVTIATVTDIEDADGSLTVTATSVPTGITVTNITNTNGTVTADVAATVAATLGNNSVILQVEDSLAQTNTDTLTVNVIVNTTPVITAAGAISVQQGATVTGVTIATVSDAEDADGTLVVTATVVPTGVTVTNIANTGGTITADIMADGTSTLGTNSITLQVVDSLSTANTATLTVNVTGSGGGGGGGDDDEDCSTSPGNGYWFLLLMGVTFALIARRKDQTGCK